MLRWVKLRCVFAVLAFIVLLLVGCSTYQNVTAYFNTYYNAQKTFDDAVNDVVRSQQAQAGKDTNYFFPAVVKSDGQSKFDKVIEKCSKIIQFYPQCKLVDDAIIMIGKSYVYEGEYESAIRKFKELLENFPASDRRIEAKLWFAKAEYYSGREDEAIKIVEEVVPEALGSGENDFALEAVMLEAQIFFNRSDYQHSAEQFDRATKVSGGNSLRAIAQYQLGQSYQRQNEYKQAAEAYLGVKEFKPDFVLRTRSKLQAGAMLLKIGEYEKALGLYDDLKGDLYKPDELAPVELGIADVYAAMGDTGTAFSMYTRIDTTYRRTDVAAKSYYHQALMYEEKNKAFDKALDLFYKAGSEFPSSEIAPLANKKVDVLTNYFTSYDNLNLYDSLLRVIPLHDTLAVQPRDTLSPVDSVTSQQSVALHSDSLHSRRAERSLLKRKRTSDEVVQRDNRSNNLVLRQHRSRGHDDFDDDDVEISYSDAGSSSQVQTDSLAKMSRVDIIRMNDKARVQRTRYTADTLRFLLTQSKFELGGLFLLDLGLPDSAMVWFQTVVHDTMSSALAPRALYALAEIYRGKHDSSAVDSLFRILLGQYSGTEYAREVRRLRGIKEKITDADSANARYSEAQHQLVDGKTLEAVNMLKEIAGDYPTSRIAPKAQYAVGWIYENILVQNDSAANWYRRLIKAFPATVYASTARAKVAVRDHPDSLSHYMGVKEAGPADSLSAGKKEGLVEKQKKGENEEEQLRRQRGKEEGVEEENSDEQNTDEEKPDNSDDNKPDDNSDDNNNE